MKRYIFTLVILLILSLVTVKGQDAKPTKQAFKVPVVLGSSHSTDWSWRRTSGTSFYIEWFCTSNVNLSHPTESRDTPSNRKGDIT